MKSVLISIRPEWCELIASGKKTVEVRKTKPKLETPFKVYIYCTKDEPMYRSGDKFWCPNDECGNGKVIGEFVCEEIKDMRDEDQEPTCLSVDEWLKYTDGHKGAVYGWHISDLVIYEEPRSLDDFFHACNKPKGTDCAVCLDHRENNCKAITRAPQSWCYVEEV